MTKNKALKRKLQAVENFSGVDVTNRQKSKKTRVIHPKNETPHAYRLTERHGYSKGRHLGGNTAQ